MPRPLVEYGKPKVYFDETIFLNGSASVYKGRTKYKFVAIKRMRTNAPNVFCLSFLKLKVYIKRSKFYKKYSKYENDEDEDEFSIVYAKDVKNEIELLKECQNKYVLSLLASYWHKDKVDIVTELCSFSAEDISSGHVYTPMVTLQLALHILTPIIEAV